MRHGKSKIPCEVLLYIFILPAIGLIALLAGLALHPMLGIIK